MSTDALLVAAMVVLTVVAYAATWVLYAKYKHALLQPVFVSAALIIVVLLLGGTDFETYRPAKELLAWALGPATVALAVPIFRQRARLRLAALPLTCGVGAGTAVTIAAVIGLAAIAQLEELVLRTLAVKSVTAPIAIELARLHGGDPSLASAFVIVTGMLGAMFGPIVLTCCGVTDPLARGIALGTTSHGQGTAAALMESEVAGAMSSLAMAGSAVLTALIAPVYIPLLLRWLT